MARKIPAALKGHQFKKKGKGKAGAKKALPAFLKKKMGRTKKK